MRLSIKPFLSKCILFLILSLFCLPLYAAKTAILLDVKSSINPAIQDYIERGIHLAEKENAEIIILRLDTPGGLDESMRGIVKAILSSKVPVATYVAPSGARAASAGTFIVYASHIAAMAPGTNLGAASPIAIGGISQEKESQSKTLSIKSANDAAALIRSLAELRGRNAEWGENAVQKAVSF